MELRHDNNLYVISALVVFFFAGQLGIAGLGAAFLVVQLFYNIGMPLAEATPATLLLNVVSMLFAAVNYWRSKLTDWRLGLPVLVTDVVCSPIGAPQFDSRIKYSKSRLWRIGNYGY